MNMEHDQETAIYVETEKVLQIMNAAEENIAESKQKQKEGEEYITKLSDCLDSLTRFCTASNANLDDNSCHNSAIETISTDCRNHLQQTYKGICENIINENILKEIEETLNTMEDKNTIISKKYLNEAELMEQLIEEKNKQIKKDNEETIILEKQLFVEIAEIEEQLVKENEEIKDFQLKIQDEQLSKQQLETDIESMQKEIEQNAFVKKELEDKLKPMLESINAITSENEELKLKSLERINQHEERIKAIETEINEFNETADEHKANLQTFAQKELDVIQEIERLKINRQEILELTEEIEQNTFKMDESITADIIIKEEILSENILLLHHENETTKNIDADIENLKSSVEEAERAIADLIAGSNIFEESQSRISEETLQHKQEYDHILMKLEKLATEKDFQQYLADMQLRLCDVNKLVTEVLENESENNNNHIKEIERQQNEILQLENENKEIQGKINQEVLNLNKVKLDKAQVEKEQEKLKAEKGQIENLYTEINKIKSMEAKFVKLKNQKLTKQTPSIPSDVTDFTKPKAPMKPVIKNKHTSARHWDSDSSVEGEVNCLQHIKSKSSQKNHKSH